MNKIMKRLCLTVIAIALLLSMLSSCKNSEENTETGTGTGADTSTEAPKDFDYESANISDYITLSENEYLNSSVTLGYEYVITDEYVDAYINVQLFNFKTKTNGNTQVVDQPIKKGDSAFIYYTGYLNGEAFEGGSNTSDKSPYELSIGSGSFIPGFEEGLIGLIPQETSKDAPFDLHVTFPNDYQSTDLAGKAVVFKVWVAYTVQYTIPALTDEIVKDSFKYDGTAEEYRVYLKDKLVSEKKAEAENEAINILMSALVEKAVFHSLPQEGVDYWYSSYSSTIQQYVDYYKMYGYSVTFEQMATQMLGLKEGDDWKAALTKMSEDAVKMMLIYYSIADTQGIEITDADVIEQAKEIAESYSSASKTYTYEEILENLGEDVVRQNVLIEKVEALLVKECTIDYNY